MGGRRVLHPVHKVRSSRSDARNHKAKLLTASQNLSAANRKALVPHEKAPRGNHVARVGSRARRGRGLRNRATRRSTPLLPQVPTSLRTCSLASSLAYVALVGYFSTYEACSNESRGLLALEFRPLPPLLRIQTPLLVLTRPHA